MVACAALCSGRRWRLVLRFHSTASLDFTFPLPACQPLPAPLSAHWRLTALRVTAQPSRAALRSVRRRTPHHTPLHSPASHAAGNACCTRQRRWAGKGGAAALQSAARYSQAERYVHVPGCSSDDRRSAQRHNARTTAPTQAPSHKRTRQRATHTHTHTHTHPPADTSDSQLCILSVHTRCHAASRAASAK